MPFLKNVPEIVKVNGKWEIDGFLPGPAAVNWPQFKGRKGTVYVVEAAGYYKIGLATDFKKRFRGIDLGTPLPVAKVAIRTVPLAGLAYAEAWLHEQFKDRRIKGEWFAIQADEAVGLLEKAVRRACLYEDASADWWWAERERYAPYLGSRGRFPVPTCRDIPFGVI